MVSKPLSSGYHTDSATLGRICLREHDLRLLCEGQSPNRTVRKDAKIFPYYDGSSLQHCPGDGANILLCSLRSGALLGNQRCYGSPHQPPSPPSTRQKSRQNSQDTTRIGESLRTFEREFEKQEVFVNVGFLKSRTYSWSDLQFAFRRKPIYKSYEWMWGS